jgi:hypothetical protein
MSTIRRFILHFGLILVAVTSGYLSAGARYRPVRASFALGFSLPAVALHDVEGNSVVVPNPHGNAATIFIVASTNDCLSCARYPYELRKFGGSASTPRAHLIISDPDTAYAKQLINSNRLKQYALLDPSGQFLDALQLKETPVFVVLNALGKVVLIDDRSSSRFAKYPASEWVDELEQILTSFGSTTSATTQKSPVP